MAEKSIDLIDLIDKSNRGEISAREAWVLSGLTLGDFGRRASEFYHDAHIRWQQRFDADIEAIRQRLHEEGFTED